MTTAAPPPPAIADSQRLLGLVQALSHELRPGVTGITRLGLAHELERDFGLDSLARVELLTRIESDMGVRLGEAALSEAETPQDLLRLIAAWRDTSGSRTQAPTPAPLPATSAAQPTRPGREGPANTTGIATDRSAGPPDSLDTLIDLLDWHVATHGERTHITLYGALLGEDDRFDEISYTALRADALTVAAGIMALGVESGGRVAIMLPTGREFFAAFYGALYAHCVPVPLYPPARPSQLEEHMRRIAGILANAEAAVLITDVRAKPLSQILRAQCESLKAVSTVVDLSAHGEKLPVPSRSRHATSRRSTQDLALLQYTSGSTGDPKGVALSHANLLANLRAMETATGIDADDVFVAWLPLYHDMGLIGACLGSLCVGFHLVLMSPLAFLASPQRWLRTIARHRATVSAAPNFAYALCADKLGDADLDGLDLSTWRLAYNGAEPVSPETTTRFATRFARFGFRASAMTPVYGLAESSVGLAFPPLGRGPRVDRVDRKELAQRGRARPSDDAHARPVMACGRALPGHTIRIVNAEGRELPERLEGRVQFCGPSATCGYYRNPAANARLFDGDWLNTGDLGYLADGELFLTGREKDIIIRGGQNVHPQELEEAVSRLPGVRPGGVAVFPASGGSSGTERLVVLAETRAEGAGERERIRADIDRVAVELLGIPADDIVLARAATVSKTSSGKIRRAACRERYERGTLSGPPRALWQQMLRLAGAGIAAQTGRLLSRTRGVLWGAWAWLVFACLSSSAWLLIATLPSVGQRRRVAHRCARLALTLTGLRPQVDGLQHCSDERPLVVVVNHASYLDGLILTAALPPRFTYIAKQELQAQPLARIPLRRLGAIFVDRFDTAQGAEDTRALEARVGAGESVVFFPEGTFHQAPGLLPFRMGAFLVAARASAAVLPVTLTGTRELLPDTCMWPRHQSLTLRIDAPLAPTAPLREAGDAWQVALKLRNRARQLILEKLGEGDAA